MTGNREIFSRRAAGGETESSQLCSGSFQYFQSPLGGGLWCYAAEKLGLPVILHICCDCEGSLGLRSLGARLRQLAEGKPPSMCSSIDHCQDVELAKACVDAGWDAVMYDGSRLPFEENIAGCREVVEYAHSKGVQVEGELGRIVGVEDAIRVSAEDASLAGLGVNPSGL